MVMSGRLRVEGVELTCRSFRSGSSVLIRTGRAVRFKLHVAGHGGEWYRACARVVIAGGYTETTVQRLAACVNVNSHAVPLVPHATANAHAVDMLVLSLTAIFGTYIVRDSYGGPLERSEAPRRTRYQ